MSKRFTSEITVNLTDPKLLQEKLAELNAPNEEFKKNIESKFEKVIKN